MKPSSPSTVSAAQNRRRQRKQRKENEGYETLNPLASLPDEKPYVQESDKEIKDTLLSDRTDAFADTILLRLDRIEAMLKSKAIQIVMDLSDKETLLVKQALEKDAALESGPCAAGNAVEPIDIPQKYEPECEDSPLKPPSDATEAMELVGLTCLHFDLAKDDTAAEILHYKSGSGKGKGSVKYVSEESSIQLDESKDAATPFVSTKTDAYNNDFTEMLDAETWAAVRTWDKSQWDKSEVKEMAFYDSLLGATCAEFPANMPLIMLMARYCYKKKLDLKHVSFSIWGETVNPQDTWNTLHAKHNIDSNDIIDVTRLMHMS